MADDARSIAARVLARVWREGAYAMPALDAELSRLGRLDRREAALATELVYGVLRTAPLLEERIAAHARNDRWKKTPATRAHLLIAAYTLLFLERVPAFAAVDEAVRGIKGSADRKVAGFANAVLRKLAAEPRTTTLPEAIAASVPAWLVAALGQALGPEAVEAYLAPGTPAPPAALCLRAGEERERWIERLREAAPEAHIEAGRISERAIVVRGAGNLKALPGAGEAWVVQEEGAQAIALAAGARPGERVLDACAGRGGKALLLAEAVGPEGTVDAADRHPSKLARLGGAAGAAAIGELYAVDWTRGSGEVPGDYDRVVVDAPCTGVGTLRRRPEILGRLSASDVTRMAALQVEIARRAAGRLKPEGRLVYAVCSVLREECEDVVAALCSLREGEPQLVPAAFDSPLGCRLSEGGSSFRLLPHRHETDGYFVAILMRAW